MNILEEILYPVIDEFNQTLADGAKLAKSPDTQLFGSDNALDSMQLVSFVVAVEEAVLDNAGHDLVLADDKAMSRRNSPFRDVTSLAEYIEELIGELS